MQYISPREYARRTGQHFTTVYKKIDSGEIPFKLVKKTVMRVPWDDTNNRPVNAK